MGQLPGASAGEGVAGCPGRRVPAATGGQPRLCVGSFTVGKVGEGADPASIGMEKPRSSADTVTGVSARYQDH